MKTGQPNGGHAIDRRHFVGVGLAALATGPSVLRGGEPAGKTMVIAVAGLGRGQGHIQACLELPDVEVGYVCDVDARRVAAALKMIENSGRKYRRPPQGVADFRKALDNKNVDALSIATPNHWHAPAAILACQAGKHVYVEKPGSHNAREALWLMAAAQKHGRVVQLGTQRRSWTAIRKAIAKLHEGLIGPVRSARCWYCANRPGIGRGKLVPVPAHLDYRLWEGPAPHRPYKDNLVHYNWHWHWHWGGGELANNGVHGLDIARWGLGVEAPRRVSCVGGRYHFRDDQETPDTFQASYDFGDKMILFDCSSCHPRPADKLDFVRFYGDGGTLDLNGGDDYVFFDHKGKEIARGQGKSWDRIHFEDFFDAIRQGRKPLADIGEGQKAALLCHLGNIAYRTGRTLNLQAGWFDLVPDREMTPLWGREYAKDWEPRV